MARVDGGGAEPALLQPHGAASFLGAASPAPPPLPNSAARTVSGAHEALEFGEEVWRANPSSWRGAATPTRRAGGERERERDVTEALGFSTYERPFPSRSLPLDPRRIARLWRRVERGWSGNLGWT
jgi:hypothetical protein